MQDAKRAAYGSNVDEELSYAFRRWRRRAMETASVRFVEPSFAQIMPRCCFTASAGIYFRQERRSNPVRC